MNTDLPNIFNLPIINKSIDFYWDDSTTSLLDPRETLVFSAPFSENSDEEIQLLKILAACQLSSQLYHLMPLKIGQKVSWPLLKEQTKAKKVMLFGISPQQLGIAALFIPNEVNNFDGVVWMPMVSILSLSANDHLKKELWVNVFKKVYNL